MNDDGPHILYRLCDGRRRLLYVGITLNPLQRLRRHRSTQEWWDQVREIYLEMHGSRRLLLIAEQEAIDAERPAYNLMGSDPSLSSDKPFDELLCPRCKKPAFYRRTEDRFYHLDGSCNRDCWLECTRGNVEVGATNVWGRELTRNTWYEAPPRPQYDPAMIRHFR